MINVIYIHSHDTGRYVQPYGHSIPTPRIQQFAEEGALFRRAFCANPTCSPSRACLLTGQWAHSCGMGGLVNRGWSLPHPERLLPAFLREQGYQTVRTGIQHVVNDPQEGGYERIDGGDGGDMGSALRAASFIAESHDRPFFLDVGFGVTHRKGEGFDGPPEGVEPADPRYVRPPSPLPDTPETRADMALYMDSARMLDALVGTVLDAVDAHGLRDSTLVVCTTDHGIAFPRMKCNLTDHGMGVMLILRGPGGFTGGQVVDGLTSHIDLFPTVCDVAGLAAPQWLQGVSLRPLVGGADSVRDAVYGEINYHVCYEPQRALRTDRWKYIRRLHERACPVLPDCDDGQSKSYLMKHGWSEREEAEERLYDVLFDPDEAHNVAMDTAYADVLKDMRQQMQTWREETGDPLLSEPIFVPPATAQIADPGERSPRSAPAHSARIFLGVD